MSAEPIVRRLRVLGRVQGVGYRYAFAEAARSAGISGWVANRHDGSVEAMVRGTPDAVEAIAAWARHGPAQASVSSVEIEPADGEFDAFRVASSF